MNCHVRGLASIGKGLGTKNTPFLVSSNSIIESGNVSGRLLGENFKVSEKLFLQTRRGPNREGSQIGQSGRVIILPIRKGSKFANLEVPVFANPKGSLFCQCGRVPNSPILRGPIFANPEVSQFYQSGRVTNSPIRKDPNFANPEGFQFRQSGGFLFLPIQKCPYFANPEGSQIRQSGGVLFLPIRKGHNFTNPEGSRIRQSGMILILPIRKGPKFANPEGYYFVKT